jgi:prepilin-type N-terminal cleavage/methylation domain-containing protein
MNRQQRGFTLIEVLVVVSILGVLMGLVSVLVLRAGGQRRKMETESLVKTYLPNLIEENDTNACNECLLVALRHPDFTAPLGDGGDLPVTDTPYGNTDEDSWNMVPDGSDAALAREILDAHGNPVVYIHKNAYGTAVRIVNAQGVEVDVEAMKKHDGTYYNPTSYQIISVGENGEQERDDLDASDDARNFKLEED